MKSVGILSSLLLLFALSACNDENGPVGGGDGTDRVFEPSADTVLSGNHRFERVTIPLGVTVRTQSDLRLESDADFALDGRIVAECGDLVLRAGRDLRFSGEVINDCSSVEDIRGTTRADATRSLLIDGARIRSGTEVRLSNDPSIQPSASFTGDRQPITAQERVCDLQIVEILPLPEVPPSSSTGSTDGNDVILLCNGPMRVAGLTVRSQSGSAGGEEISKPVAGDATASGNDGGRGGNVILFATSSILVEGRNRLEGGDGGKGGAAEAIAEDSGSGSSGSSASALAGDGGDSGHPIIRAASTVDLQGEALELIAGSGGDGGDARAVAADGQTLPDDTRQAGGKAVAIGGMGGNVLAPVVENLTGRTDRVLLRAGNAGTGGSAGGRAGDGSRGVAENPTGGRGGDLEVRGGRGGDIEFAPSPSASAPKPGEGGNATLLGANGGPGHSACPGLTSPPAGSAGDGGPGGTLHASAGIGGVSGGTAGTGVGGAFVSATSGIILIDQAGNGGSGGDGDPPGEGGSPGSPDIETASEIIEVEPALEPGPNGGPCPPETSLSLAISIDVKSDPAGQDPDFFDAGANPLGGREHAVRIRTLGDQISISGADPWVDVLGTIATDDTIDATGTGSVEGREEEVSARFDGSFDGQTLQGEYELTPAGQPSIVYDVIGIVN